MNGGFSAAEEIFGQITGLKAKESSDGRSTGYVEAQNSDGDTVASDIINDVMAPSVTYAVTANITATSSNFPQLGSIHTYKQKKIMLTQVVVTTQQGQPPTVTLSGQQVEDAATTKRTYPVAFTLKAACKAQDVVSAFTASTKFTAFTATFSVDFVNQTVAGSIVASCCTHGKVEEQATMTDSDGEGSITAATNGGFVITAAPAESDPDANYITRTATATKFLTGTDPTTGGGSQTT